MNCQTGWGLRSFTRSMTPRRWLAGGSNKSNQYGNRRFPFGWLKTPCCVFVSHQWHLRGVSSVVRRCVHRHTGQELAVKIIEITAEKMTAQQLEEVKTSTLKEIQVLNMVKGHSSISMFGSFWPQDTLIPMFLRDSKVLKLCLFLLVTLIDSYESTTFIFLVFDLWVLQQILPLYHVNINFSIRRWYQSLVFVYSMRRGELFDYLTEKVTLNEKETRWAPPPTPSDHLICSHSYY